MSCTPFIISRPAFWATRCRSWSRASRARRAAVRSSRQCLRVASAAPESASRRSNPIRESRFLSASLRRSRRARRADLLQHGNGRAPPCTRPEEAPAFPKESMNTACTRPGFGNDLGAIMGADFGFIGLDNGIECCRIDIAFFSQDGFQRAHPQLGLGQFRMVMVVVMMIVVVACHGLRIDAIFGLCRGTDSVSLSEWGFGGYV